MGFFNLEKSSFEITFTLIALWNDLTVLWLEHNEMAGKRESFKIEYQQNIKSKQGDNERFQRVLERWE